MMREGSRVESRAHCMAPRPYLLQHRHPLLLLLLLLQLLVMQQCMLQG